MEPDFKLPPRLYYSLEQAAKELKCDSNYLLHLGATSRLILVHPVTDYFHLEHSHDIFAGLFADFVELMSNHCRHLEFNSQTKASVFYHIYELEQGDSREKIRISAKDRLPTDAELAPLESPYFKAVSPTSSSPEFCLTIHRDNIYILDNEIERIKQDNPLPKRIADSLHSSKTNLENNLPKRTENKLYEVITALAIDRLGLETVKTTPRAAAQTLIKELEQTGNGNVVSDQTLEAYLLNGLERLNK